MSLPDEATAAPTEVELKFSIAPEDLRRLRRHPLLAGAPIKRQSLVATYYDTPDLALYRRSLTLRIRKEGRRYVQTLKEGNPSVASGFGRLEWQAPVARLSPDLSAPDFLPRLGDLDGALHPVFTSRVRRLSCRLHPMPGTTIELCCDQGQIEAPNGARLPICEIELELKQGQTQALFAVARALNQQALLRLEMRSKSARGYALIENADFSGVVPQRHPRTALDGDMSAEAALGAVVRHCLQHLLVNDPAALSGQSEGVHQMRVALRRLRAALKLFKAMIPDDQRAWAVGEIKWITRSLGSVRNWDVFAELLEPVREAFAADRDLSALSQAVADRQRLGHEEMRRVLLSSRYTDFALQLLTWADTRNWRRPAVAEMPAGLLSPIGELAPALLRRRYRKVRNLVKTLDIALPEQRHRLRIALKELRYAVDFLAPIYDAKTARRYVKRLGRLQDDLGLLQDIATIDALARRLPEGEDGTNPARAAAIMLGWYGHAAAESTADLGKKLRRFLKADPFWDEAAA